MKAIKLLREMDYDSALAENGMIIDISADRNLKTWFGESAKLESGKVEIEDYSTPYYAIWLSNIDKIQWFIQKYGYDARIKTDEDIIYLHKIEG